MDTVALRMIAGEHYRAYYLRNTSHHMCVSFSQRSIEEVAPEDLGLIDIILNGQI